MLNCTDYTVILNQRSFSICVRKLKVQTIKSAYSLSHNAASTSACNPLRKCMCFKHAKSLFDNIAGSGIHVLFAAPPFWSMCR